MLIIKKIVKNSLARQKGLQIGDKILEINNQPVRDEIDFRFLTAEENLKIKILRDGVERTYKITKEYDENIGIEFDEMNCFSCGSDCIFCFVTQNPKGLRKSLYFQDGDYRMSFLYGNYVTLTNVGPNSLKRIVTLRLSPIYVSVHSTDLQVRKYYMNLKKDDRLLDKLKYLVDNNIKIHTQIVLSPGINDGDSLFNTISDLYSLSKGIESLAIVPVGLTRHRKNLAKLTKVSRLYAKNLIKQIEPIQNNYRKEVGKTWIYLSDEFYLLAGSDLPEESKYDEYPQIENGVGMCRLFYEQFLLESKKLPRKTERRRNITFATGLLAHKFLSDKIMPILNDIQNLEIDLIPIKNSLFGASVTVSGLLSMNCLLKGLKNKKIGDVLILPSNIINHDGIFLDDGTPEELGTKLSTNVFIFKNSWKGLFKYLENL